VANSRPAKALVSLKASPSFGVGQAAGEGPSVLILADTDVVATSALAASLADSGVQVTVRPAPEYTWDGTNPSLNGFNVVIHLNGATYDYPLSSDAQAALAAFVQAEVVTNHLVQGGCAPVLCPVDDREDLGLGVGNERV